MAESRDLARPAGGEVLRPFTMVKVRTSIVERCREAAERRGLTFVVGHDHPEWGGRQVYVIDGKTYTPGEALDFLGVVWP